MFNEEYNDYEEYENPTMSAEQQEHLEKVKDHLARANWQAIKTNGIDVEYYSDSEKVQILKDIITETLQYFEEIEEYEKCTDLKRALDQI